MSPKIEPKIPKINVLVIEDSPTDARLLREMLSETKESNFEVECLDRLSTGLKRLGEGGIDVVLLDLSLPDSHGLDTLAKTYSQAPSVPIIVLTGYSDERFALEAVQKGAQDYLVKGQIDSKLLSRVMRYAIGRKHATEETPNPQSLTVKPKLPEQPPPAERLRACGLLPWLEEAVASNASDIFLSIGEPPTLKVYGSFKRIGNTPLTTERLLSIIDVLLPETKRWQFLEGREVDFSLEVDKLSRFRINVFKEHRGDSVTFRPIPRRIPTFDELGLPPILDELSHLTRGLILVTGPTGNGKTTSLAALIDTINRRDDRHIITIEDPIEYVIPHQKSLVHQREVELHTRSFADGLRSAFRENPDVIMVGELRDLESVSLAIRAAETGHLVLGTLHSGSATQAITRIIDVFEEGSKGQVQSQLAQSLQAVISQRLFKKQVGEGMVLATEVLIATQAVRNLIRSNNLPQLQSYLETGMRDGMHTLKQSVQELIKKGLLDSKTLTQLELDGTSTGPSRRF